MREIVFGVLKNNSVHFKAEAVLPSDGQIIKIAAATLEDLYHEARGALIDHLGDAHCAYQVRLRRGLPVPVCAAYQPLLRPAELTPQPAEALGAMVPGAQF